MKNLSTIECMGIVLGTAILLLTLLRVALKKTFPFLFLSSNYEGGWMKREVRRMNYLFAAAFIPGLQIISLILIICYWGKYSIRFLKEIRCNLRRHRQRREREIARKALEEMYGCVVFELNGEFLPIRCLKT